MTPDAGRGRTLRGLAGLTVFALALRVAGLSSQPLIGDDTSVAQTARNFVDLGLPSPTMWNHPRLRDLLVYVSMDLLGDGAWGIKFWSVALGTLSVAAVALLLLELGAGRAAALTAALLLAIDPLHLDFSRQGINDVHLAVLPVGAILALLRYQRTGRPAWLAGAGLLLGLGLAEKWSVAFPVGVAAAVVASRRLPATSAGQARTAEAALFAAALGLLPLAVYLLTWWPWFGRGHDLAEWLQLHLRMARETSTHVGYPGTKLPGFPGEVVQAWRWFVQPVWYVDYIRPMPGRDQIPAGGLFLAGVANPLAWMATLPATAWAGWRWLRTRDATAGWLALLLLAAWLPFVLVPRPVWTNSALAVAPFAMAVVGWAAARLQERFRWPVRIWAGAAVVLAGFLWLPAVAVSTAPTDAFLRTLVSPAALDPANHP